VSIGSVPLLVLVKAKEGEGGGEVKQEEEAEEEEESALVLLSSTLCAVAFTSTRLHGLAMPAPSATRRRFFAPDSRASENAGGD